MERLEKLDTLGTSVLRAFKKLPIYQDAVIAGGYIRDLVNNKPFRDVDIFVPKFPMSKLEFPEGFVPGETHMMIFGDIGYRNMEFRVFNCKFLEAVDVQLIMSNLPSENFIERLLPTFDYGICQAWSDGEDCFGTKAFVDDQKNGTATLLNLKNLTTDLPLAMKRFLKLQEKYPTLKFRCPNLEFKKSDPVVHVDRMVIGSPSTPPPFSIGNIAYLSWTVDDIVDEDGNIDWDKIDQMMSAGNEDVTNHAHALVIQYDEMNDTDEEGEGEW